MKLRNNLICIDIETTDLDPECGNIIQIGAILVDKQFKCKQNETFNIYIKPLTKHRNFASMKINNISEEILENAIELNEALELFENFCGQNKYLAMWGNYFDEPFLKKQYKKINRFWPFMHTTIDLKSIVTWELAKQNIQITGLKTAVKKMNLHYEGKEHDALSDIQTTINILTQLLAQQSNNMQIGW